MAYSSTLECCNSGGIDNRTLAETQDNNTGQGVYTINGISNDVIGDGIRMTTDPSRGFGYALSSDDPITWDPNPFWVQRAVEYGVRYFNI